VRRLTLALLLALAACNRGPADVTLDADAELRNATRAKIDADIAAAEAATRAPMPRIVPRVPQPQSQPQPRSPADEAPARNDRG